MMSDGETATAELETDESKDRLDLKVEISEVGPCRKHVVVTVLEDDIARIRNEAIDELSDKAEVPGFRVGRVPRELLEKRFREEIVGDVKQKVLLQSLDQLSDDKSIDPINQPEIDVESLDIPESGDFRYEFDVEVRPEFDLPDYESFTIERTSGEISEEEFDAFRAQFLASHAERNKVDRPAQKGDFVVCHLRVRHNDRVICDKEEVSLQLQSQLRFQDCVCEDFDKLMDGATAGDTRSVELTISLQSPVVEMRGETVQAEFRVTEVHEHVVPDIDREFLDRLDAETEEDLNEQLTSALKRQVEYQQRQSTRQQVLRLIQASADWDLPESLVEQQTENALRREILEMSQAGFTRQHIEARENEIRQNAIENTREALKEHFVLDRIATQQNIECEPADVDHELMMMAFQTGESPRRIRARMVKSGMIDNLEAQLRERKAVDFIISKASFQDVDREPFAESDVSTASFAICGNLIRTSVVSHADDESDDDSDDT